MASKGLVAISEHLKIAQELKHEESESRETSETSLKVLQPKLEDSVSPQSSTYATPAQTVKLEDGRQPVC